MRLRALNAYKVFQIFIVFYLRSSHAGLHNFMEFHASPRLNHNIKFMTVLPN